MMLFSRSAGAIALVCVVSVGLSSCLARRRAITRTGGRSSQGLQVTTKDVLIQAVSRLYQSVHDLNATVDMTPALGSAENSKITEYKDVRAYILFRKESDIRIIGLYPVVRTKAFDMTSNGTDFRLYIPSKNRFLIGKNELGTPSKNKLENLRPQHFLEALLVRPMAEPSRTMLENYTDEQNAFYIIHEVEQRDGRLLLARTVWFNRLNLRISRQMIFDDAGNILTDARYDDWQVYDGVLFPKHVEINRPRDEYAVVIDVVKMDINKGVTNDKFELSQPEGSTLQVVGQPAANPKEPAPPRKKTSN